MWDVEIAKTSVFDYGSPSEQVTRDFKISRLILIVISVFLARLVAALYLTALRTMSTYTFQVAEAVLTAVVTFGPMIVGYVVLWICCRLVPSWSYWGLRVITTIMIALVIAWAVVDYTYWQPSRCARRIFISSTTVPEVQSGPYGYWRLFSHSLNIVEVEYQWAEKATLLDVPSDPTGECAFFFSQVGIVQSDTQYSFYPDPSVCWPDERFFVLDRRGHKAWVGYVSK